MKKLNKGIKDSLELKGGINGLKTILGITFTEGASKLVEFANWIITFPYAEKTQLVVQTISNGIDWFAWGLDIIGQVFLLLGIAHKIYKLLKPVFTRVPKVQPQ